VTAPAYDEFAEVYARYNGAPSRMVWQLGVGAELAKLVTGPARVLDLGAGTGVGTEILAEMAPEAEVTALDQSVRMLERSGVPPERRVVADFADFRVPGPPFDLVVSGFGTLNYLPLDRMADCLACVSDALRPGGYLVFDYSSRRFLSVEAGGPPVDVPCAGADDGHRLHRRRHTFETALNRSRTYVTYYRGDQPLWRHTHVNYAFDPYALEELARAAGLETLVVRNLVDQQFGPGQPMHVYLMQRVD
jgi:SAM-dependent methyltransferase